MLCQTYSLVVGSKREKRKGKRIIAMFLYTISCITMCVLMPLFSCCWEIKLSNIELKNKMVGYNATELFLHQKNGTHLLLHLGLQSSFSKKWTKKVQLFTKWGRRQGGGFGEASVFLLGGLPGSTPGQQKFVRSADEWWLGINWIY